MAELFRNVPDNLRKLVPEPCFDTPHFESLRPDQCSQLANSVKTKTLLDVLQPPHLAEPDTVAVMKPTILVFCQPSQEIDIECKGNNYPIYPYAPVSYSQWLEGAGAKCIPLPYNINQGSIQYLLQRSNGLLIPGGGSNLYKNFNKREGQGPVMIGFLKVWRFIQKLWSKGINYPIWGTCLGFQIMLLALTGDVKILSQLNSRGHQVEIFSDYQNSLILKKMPWSLRFKSENFKLMNFMHSYGISVKKFLSEPKLMEKMKVTQISKDKDGRWFCSGLEGKTLPIFITQYHPEKQAYQWTRNGDIRHNKDSVQLSHFYAASFLAQCRKIKPPKQFGSQLQNMFYSIHQYKQVHTPAKLYKVYAIDFKYRYVDKEARKQIKNRRSVSTQKTLKSPFV